MKQFEMDLKKYREMKVNPQFNFICDKCNSIGLRGDCIIAIDVGYCELCPECYYEMGIYYRTYIIH